jgi:hypothetical protein
MDGENIQLPLYKTIQKEIYVIVNYKKNTLMQLNAQLQIIVV